MSKAIQLLKKKGSSVKAGINQLSPPLPPSVNLGKSNIAPPPSNPQVAIQNASSKSILFSPKIPKDTIQKNAPAISDQFIEQYSPLEKTIQNIEEANDFVSNIGFGAGFLNFASPASKLAQKTKPLTKVGGKTNYVQAGLYAVDAARALVDPEYRDKVQDGLNRMFDNSQGNTDLISTGLAHGLQRPIAFTAGLLRNVQNTRDEIKKNMSEIKVSNDRIEKHKLNIQSRITTKGAKNIGSTGVNFRNFMDTRRDEGIIFNQYQDYKNQAK